MRTISVGTLVSAALAALPCAVATPAHNAATRTLIVTSYEYVFQAPEQVSAGAVTVRLVNHGKMGHQAVFLRLDDSSSLVRVMGSLVADTAHTTGVRGVGGIENANPGDSSETILVLRPGRYVIVCAYNGGGHAHVSMGMIRTLTVTADAMSADSKLPATPVTVRLTDYHIVLSGPLHAGRQLVRVENDGLQRHHLSIMRFVGSTSLEELDKWDGKSKPSPIETVSGGTTILDAGQASVVALDLQPGRYLLECALANDAKSKPHYMLGMERIVAINSR
jgi:plastocyanin